MPGFDGPVSGKRHHLAGSESPHVSISPKAPAPIDRHRGASQPHRRRRPAGSCHRGGYRAGSLHDGADRRRARPRPISAAATSRGDGPGGRQRNDRRGARSLARRHRLRRVPAVVLVCGDLICLRPGARPRGDPALSAQARVLGRGVHAIWPMSSAVRRSRPAPHSTPGCSRRDGGSSRIRRPDRPRPPLRVSCFGSLRHRWRSRVRP